MQYKDTFVYIANVTSGVANQVLLALNNPKSMNWKRDETEDQLLNREIDDTRDGASNNWTFGYVTKDVRVPCRACAMLIILA
jgi:hypothetical protein